ncbi:MAG: hypothetical protein DHS20C21_19920 [Gemmatimonadota bacterium]|nr:MAG: hypothetical protein DHS20C21_19920 [Gemmatimonadota bacterium]
MFGGRRTRKGSIWTEVLIAGAALLAGLAVSQAFAVEPPTSRKMARQIDVMEKIMDQVLVDSPNFLVSGRGTTRGLFVKNYGVIFTFSASLVDKGSNWSFDFGEGFKVYNEEGKRVIVLDGDDVVQDYMVGDEDEEDDEGRDDRKGRSRRDRGDRVQERLYGRGKAEIVDVFLDYGDTVTTLADGEWLAIVAFLRDSSYFSEARISRLALKAKAADLRAFAAEKISEEEMVKRIVEEEY